MFFKPKSKAFFVFYWTFLSVFSLFGVIGCLYQKNYKGIIILFLIATALIVESIWLFRFFFSMADSFTVSDNFLQFIYPKGKAIEVSLHEIKEIKVHIYRYIFVADKVYTVSRATNNHGLEKSIDQKILLLSTHGITLKINKFGF